MDDIQIVILAAGEGKRMGNKKIPKALVPLKGKPLIKYLLESIKKSGVCSRPVIVVGNGADLIKEELGSDYTYSFQEEQLGTGHAVMAARDDLRSMYDIMVLYGDHPLVSAETIKKITQTHLTQGQVLTIATAKVEDFNDWRQAFINFGRIVRDDQGNVNKIVEVKDATDEEKDIKEVNPGYYCFKADWLWQNLNKLNTNNAQKEYYLTDLIALALEQGIETVEIEPKEALGVNTPEQLESIAKLV